MQLLQQCCPDWWPPLHTINKTAIPYQYNKAVSRCKGNNGDVCNKWCWFEKACWRWTEESRSIFYILIRYFMICVESTYWNNLVIGVCCGILIVRWFFIGGDMSSHFTSLDFAYPLHQQTSLRPTTRSINIACVHNVKPRSGMWVQQIFQHSH